MLSSSNAYQIVPGSGGCLRHTVLASQSAEMTFTWLGSVPSHRVILVIRVRGLVAPSTEPFDDLEGSLGYPESYFAGSTGNFVVLCHGQAADVATTPVVWDSQTQVWGRIGTTSFTNSIITTSYPQTLPITIQSLSGPAAYHSTGFFGFQIAAESPKSRSAIERNIRSLIDDLDPERYAIKTTRMRQMIEAQMELIASRTFLPQESVTSVALLAGTYDYTLTGVVGDIRQLVDDATGVPLIEVPMEEMVVTYRQDSSQPAPRGKPLAFAVAERSDQAVRIRVGPTPISTGTLDLYYGVIPSGLTSDISLIPFSEPLLRALERAVASQCVVAMSESDASRNMISADIVPVWRQMVDDAIREENMRLRITGSGTQANVIETEEKPPWQL